LPGERRSRLRLSRPSNQRCSAFSRSDRSSGRTRTVWVGWSPLDGDAGDGSDTEQRAGVRLVLDAERLTRRTCNNALPDANSTKAYLCKPRGMGHRRLAGYWSTASVHVYATEARRAQSVSVQPRPPRARCTCRARTCAASTALLLSCVVTYALQPAQDHEVASPRPSVDRVCALSSVRIASDASCVAGDTKAPRITDLSRKAHLRYACNLHTCTKGASAGDPMPRCSADRRL